MNTKPTKRQPTAADYVVRLHRNAQDYHTGALNYQTFTSANVALWAEIQLRPRTAKRVLAMLRTFDVTPRERRAS